MLLRRLDIAHTSHGDKYATVIIDHPPSRMVRARHGCWTWCRADRKKAFKTWLAGRPQWGMEVVAMDGFTGFKTTTSEELPGAVAVMDPFHVIHLTTEVLQECRRRVQ